MKSVALLLACNVEGNAADNDVKRPLSNVTDDTLNIAHEMLQMFSVHSFDEHLVDPSLLNVVRNTKMYSENKLNTCIDLLPTKLNGGIIDSTCREESQQLRCNFKCDSNDLENTLLDINFTYDAEISCRCIEYFAGIRFNVPCGWSSIPSCAYSTSTALIQVNDNVAKCGPLVQEHGDWICDGNECSLQCNHGYVAKDDGTSMVAKCLCSKHGDCRWQLPSQCGRLNQIANQCDKPYHPVGKYDCSGYRHGDQCSLQCTNEYIREQYGIRECVCDNGGGCDWVGQIGTCTQDFGLSILDDFESRSLLSSAKCDRLPTVTSGKWRCSDNAETCTLICPPGLQPNQVVNISCVCQNGRCLYSHNTATGSRFALTSDFESTIDFSCTDMYNYNYYEDDTLDKCMNLPDVQDGDWICSGNGTCALTCSNGTDGTFTEKFVIDCLNSDSTDIDMSQINCTSSVKSIMAMEKKSRSSMSKKVQDRLHF